jgi:hypothetical protein
VSQTRDVYTQFLPPCRTATRRDGAQRSRNAGALTDLFGSILGTFPVGPACGCPGVSRCEEGCRGGRGAALADFL